MAQSKKNITPENITEWLSSTGFLFPRNEIELERFEKLYGDEVYELTGKEIDPDKIINDTYKEHKIINIPKNLNTDEISTYRMVARNGKELPKHILEKIKKNHSSKNNDTPSTEETNK